VSEGNYRLFLSSAASHFADHTRNTLDWRSSRVKHLSHCRSGDPATDGQPRQGIPWRARGRRRADGVMVECTTIRPALSRSQAILRTVRRAGPRPSCPCRLVGRITPKLRIRIPLTVFAAVAASMTIRRSPAPVAGRKPNGRLDLPHPDVGHSWYALLFSKGCAAALQAATCEGLRNFRPDGGEMINRTRSSSSRKTTSSSPRGGQGEGGGRWLRERMKGAERPSRMRKPWRRGPPRGRGRKNRGGSTLSLFVCGLASSTT